MRLRWFKLLKVFKSGSVALNIILLLRGRNKLFGFHVHLRLFPHILLLLLILILILLLLFFWLFSPLLGFWLIFWFFLNFGFPLFSVLNYRLYQRCQRFFLLLFWLSWLIWLKQGFGPFFLRLERRKHSFYIAIDLVEEVLEFWRIF